MSSGGASEDTGRGPGSRFLPEDSTDPHGLRGGRDRRHAPAAGPRAPASRVRGSSCGAETGQGCPRRPPGAGAVLAPGSQYLLDAVTSAAGASSCTNTEDSSPAPREPQEIVKIQQKGFWCWSGRVSPLGNPTRTSGQHEPRLQELCGESLGRGAGREERPRRRGHGELAGALPISQL